MADVAAGPKPSSAQIQAALIWAGEHNDLARAGTLVSLVPAKDRTPMMVDLQQRASMDAEIRQATAAADRSTVRSQLLAVAAQPDPAGTRGVAVASAFIRLRDKTGARDAIVAAYRATPQPTAAQRLFYANALARAGDNDDARRLVRQIDPQRLQPLERTAYQGLADGLAIQQSDALSQEGKQAEAYDVLAPHLRADPQNPSLNLALGRLYQSDRRPREALQISEAALQRDPGDLDVRRAAVDAAVNAGELSHAGQLAAAAMQSAPDDPRPYMMVADIARAGGEDGRALAALRKARALRQQQLHDAQADNNAAPQ
ncbi:MAG: tetratricopeptide repeat protein [Acetobacteraceae bacterium]